MAWSVAQCQARAELGLCVAGIGLYAEPEAACASLWALGPESPEMLAPPCAESIVVLRVHRAPCIRIWNNNAVLWFLWWVSAGHLEPKFKLKMWRGKEGKKKRRQSHSLAPT